jgi:hypothetical protein
VRFSKHWLKQIADIDATIGSEAKIVVPSSNIEGSHHFVAQEGGADDFSFQRFARGLWRRRRGSYGELDDAPAGCAVLGWKCLSLAGPQPLSNWQHWVARLGQQGIKTYCAQDTYVGLLPEFVAVPSL